MRQDAAKWVCEHEGCWHEWLAKTDVPPSLCAKCRRRGWHVTLSTVELIRSQKLGSDLDARIEAIARRVFREEWESVPAETVDASEPVTVAELRADLSAVPLADKMAAARAALASVGTPAPSMPAPAALEPCPYTEYVPDIGETMACGLIQHSWKIPHGAWRKL